MDQENILRLLLQQDRVEFVLDQMRSNLRKKLSRKNKIRLEELQKRQHDARYNSRGELEPMYDWARYVDRMAYPLIEGITRLILTLRQKYPG